MADESWRVFCAVPVSDEVRAQIAKHVESLKAALPDAQASWTREHNIHLTLKFLGQVKRPAVERLSNAAKRATARSNSFQLQVEETGAFSERGPARVLWIGIKDPERRLAELSTHLEEECAKEGFPKEPRPLHPHLTVARLRKPHHARTLAAAHRELPFAPAVIDVCELLVIRSELGKHGSRYTVVSRHPLNPSS